MRGPEDTTQSLSVKGVLRNRKDEKREKEMKREIKTMRLVTFNSNGNPALRYSKGAASLLLQVLPTLCLLFTLFISSCSKGLPDPETEPDPFAPDDSIFSPIVFSGMLGDTVSRQMGQAPTRSLIEATGGYRPGLLTTGLEEKDVESFKVWAYKTKTVSGSAPSFNYTGLQTVMDGYTVEWTVNSAGTTSSNSSGWEYVKGEQTIKYWDLDATSYRFFGYAPATSDAISLSGSDETRTLLKIKIADEASSPYISRLWFSNNSTGITPAYLETVQMQFVKPLSKVRFRLIDINGKPFNNNIGAIDVSSIKFKPTDESGIATSGTLCVEYPLTGTATDWQVDGLVNPTDECYTTPSYLDDNSMTIPYVDKDEYIDSELAIDAAISAELAAKLLPVGAGDSDYDKWYTLMPNVSQGTYTLSITVGSINKTAVVPAIYMRWLPGYYYTYIFKVSESGIYFDAVQIALKDWGVGEAEDRSIYNW